MRVLLVDDDAQIAMVIADVLHDEGHDVAIHNGALPEDLLALVAAGRFDLVMLDLGLGQTDGAALTRELALMDDRPAILLSTGADERLVASLRAQVDGVLRKPFTVDELLGTINGIALGHESRSSVRPRRVPGERRGAG